MENSDKHAYCIMAHGNWSQLQLLLDMIDDRRNDIYLHIDKKVEVNYNKCGGGCTRYSQLIIVKSTDVRWSDVSLSDAEVKLYNAVVESGVQYNRIHLISGADLPLVSQNEMHRFFLDNHKEYIDIRNERQFEKRLKYYHFFVRYRRNNPMVDFCRRILLLFQLPFVNRRRSSQLKYAYGSGWCSLTYKAVKTIIATYLKVRHEFLYTTCSDEHYKQMILLSDGNLEFAKEGNLRYVDFSSQQPSPKTLRLEDYDKIMRSGCLFARKFDVNVDKEIVSEISKQICLWRKKD